MLALLLSAALDLTPYAGGGHALASAVVREGRIDHTETLGAPPDAAFRMASLSKVVTAYVVMGLAEEGRLDLHADVSRYVRDLPLRRHRYAKVTLHHLLTHTSGIEDAFFGNTVPLPGPVPTLEEHFRARPPTFRRAPGEALVYSNEGLALAGLVVEQVTGMRFAECVRRRVFEPLGMRSSTFEQPPPFRVVASGAEGEAIVQAPAASLVSTAGDMARLLVVLAGDSPAVRRQRAGPYGLFRDDRGGLFHTGRSAHESVLYIDPAKKTGVFLVHTGGLDRTLRKRYVASVIGPAAAPPRSNVNVRPGVYRPLMLPVARVERAGEIATDAQLAIDGHRITLKLPPFAQGQTLTFVNGVAEEGHRIAGHGDRVVLTGPLAEPMTFVRIPLWASGRAQLVFFITCAAILLSALFRTRGMSRTIFALVVTFLLAAPAAFLVSYLPRDAETRPFSVESSVRAATTMLLLCACAAVLTPFAAWRARVARVHAAIASGAALALLIMLHHWNLLGYRF